MSDSKGMVVRDVGAMTVVEPNDFGEEHMRIVKEAYCAGASDLEFMVLWQGARSRGLDPIKKQIHFVKRWDDMRGKDVWSSQVAIDGFRSIADATGEYEGQDEPEFSRDADEGHVICRVRVHRKGKRPFVGVCHFPEFVQTKKGGGTTYMWQKMPRHMLAKCAEALALRKAFPEKLSGLHVPEEMGGDSDALTAEQTPPAPAHDPAAVTAALDEACIAGKAAVEAKDRPGWAKVRDGLTAVLHSLNVPREVGEKAMEHFKVRTLPPRQQEQPSDTAGGAS